MCILESRCEKGTFLALEKKKKLLFIFTKGYFRDLTWFIFTMLLPFGVRYNVLHFEKL